MTPTRSRERRFAASRLLTARPVPGDPSRALVVIEDAGGAHGVLLDGAAAGPALPFAVDYDSLPTADGAWVVQPADGGGSEFGHLCAYAVDGAQVVDLTPDEDPYVVRGLDLSADGSTVVASLVDEDGHRVVAIPARPWVVYTTRTSAGCRA